MKADVIEFFITCTDFSKLLSEYGFFHISIVHNKVE